MTDTYQVQLDNHDIVFYQRAACFAPLKRFKASMDFKDLKGNPVSISYTISIRDSDLLLRWCDLFRSIDIFKHVIKNISKQDYAATITVDCNVKTSEMMYVLGAFRLIKEYSTERWHHLPKLLLQGSLMEVYPLTTYLILEEVYWTGKDEPNTSFAYWVNLRGHSNTDPRLKIHDALRLEKMRGSWSKNPEELNFTEYQSYDSWGSLPHGDTGEYDDPTRLGQWAAKILNKTPTAGHVYSALVDASKENRRKQAEGRKALEKRAKAVAEKKARNGMPKPPPLKVKDLFLRMKSPYTGRTEVYPEQKWKDLMRQLHPAFPNRQRYYAAGYRHGYRIRGK